MLLLFVSIACANMLIPSYVAIRQEFKIPEALIAIPDAFFLLISAVFALFWGYWADKIDRGKVLLAGAFSWTFGMILTAFSPNYLTLVFSRVISGAGLGCVLPVGYSIISDAVPAEERSGWFGTLAILSSISNGAGQGLSSFLGPLFGWRFPFLLLSGISVLVIFILFFVEIPKRGTTEDELLELVELDLEYSYRISKADLKIIVKKKTNLYLILQGFFSIIPGTVLVYFMTSMLSLQYFNQIPLEIRLQTSTIFAGMIGIGYILGNAIFSRLGDILYRRNKKNRARLATICLIFSIPFSIILLISLQPINVNKLNVNYPPSLIPTDQIGSYILQTIGAIFIAYPTYIIFFIFALMASMLGAGPVANKNAIMIDVNMPEHKGTAASFFKLSEQISKGVTLLISFTLISLLGSIFNMLFFTIFFWIPAAILWFFASKNVESDMGYKSRILSERKQLSIIDYIFELEIQMDRAIQKVQDSKYYLRSDQKKFNKLLSDALTIYKFCEREGVSRSITNIEKKAHIMYLRVQLIKHETNQIYKKLNKTDVTPEEIDLQKSELEQKYNKINEWEKSTFGEIQTFYEDANLKIIEARLNRQKHIIKGFGKISESIKIYQRVKYLINERLEIVKEKPQLSEEESIIRDKEQELYDKCTKSLNATIKLKEEINKAFIQLKDKGIQMEDLRKISELTQEFDVNLYDIILDTFKHDPLTKYALIDTLDKIDNIFKQYDNWRETDLKVF
ncbi:MAG: Inner membrane transport protein YdhP [Candidatus Lokiarchaeum sp. GC14_75]|nr:MAG: Inner membrane transport protein YdhP [Candidatus Lokiarchaeum sp. GC14_75]